MRRHPPLSAGRPARTLSAGRLPLAAALLACVMPLAALAERPAVAPAAVAEITSRPDAPLVLDVRTPEEYAAGHVPGAVLIPHDQLAARLSEIEGKPWVLVYCRSGKRAAAAEQVLADQGIEVRRIDGSWQRWEAEGLPVEKPAPAEGESK